MLKAEKQKTGKVAIKLDEGQIVKSTFEDNWSHLARSEV